MKIIKFIINILTLIIALIISFTLTMFVPIEMIVVALYSLWDNKNYFLEMDPLYYRVVNYWKENIHFILVAETSGI